LYRYLTRLLVERISWLCRDARKPNEGNGLVDLIFSDRASMSYDDIRAYFDLLRQQSQAGGDVNIHWSAINTSSLQAVAHSKLAGLQVADAVATSYFYGIKLSRYGIVDPSYVRMLKRHAYRHDANCFGYGVKFLSKIDSLRQRMPHLNSTFEEW
jgi:hypothetical protein